jgi:FkbM family methyltransferase
MNHSLFIFCDTDWGLGIMHRALAAELLKKGWNVTFHNWAVNDPPKVRELSDQADLVLTLACNAPSVLTSFGIDSKKIVAVAHDESDLQALIKIEGVTGFDKYAAYGVVSDSLVCSSLALGIPRLPTVLRLGVEFDKFYHPPPIKLEVVGYGGRMTYNMTTGVDRKRGWLAKAIADEAGLTFKTMESAHYGKELPPEAIPDYYASIDCLIMPSLREGAGQPPLEAAAAGRLVLGTPVGQFPRLAYECIGLMGPLEAKAFQEWAVFQLRSHCASVTLLTDTCLKGQAVARSRDWSLIAPEWETFLLEALGSKTDSKPISVKEHPIVAPPSPIPVNCITEATDLRSPLGGVFHLPPPPGEPYYSSRHMAESIFNGDEYDPRIPIEDVKRVLDIGANCGAFAVWALWMWRRNSCIPIVINCYEPNPEAAKYCEINVSEFAMVHLQAVTTTPFPVTLWIDPTWGASRTFEPPTDGKQIEVATVHPRDLPKCDVLKIDAEGVEPEILLHYPHLRSVKMCAYEYHRADHKFLCRAACNGAGLKLVRETVHTDDVGVDVWVHTP